MPHKSNAKLKSEMRIAYETFHVSMETIIARYDVQQDRSDEEMLMDFSRAIDEFKISIERLKGEVQEGIL